MITVVTPVSPIPSHPGTEVISETIESVRHHLPDAEIILTFDGVRPEQQARADAYYEHISRVLWLANHKWGNVYPVLFAEHTHQVGMLRTVLDNIHTPLLMYVEQDTPLMVDRSIDFDTIQNYILDGHSNLVRLSHEAQILDVHQHMFHGQETNGPFTRTSQYSARPHIASVAFYRRLLDNYFTPNAKSFLEDRLHGVIGNAYERDEMAGWNQFRMHMWTPDGDIKRSLHSDGRAGGPKFDDRQIF